MKSICYEGMNKFAQKLYQQVLSYFNGSSWTVSDCDKNNRIEIGVLI